MFHTYVLAATGSVIDFDRASFLMDKDILKESLDAMHAERDNHPRDDATYDAQWVWDYYCERHREHYGESFGPDAITGWDSSPTPMPRDPALRRRRR